MRQSLYTFEDCKGGGAPKAERAAAALRESYPGVRAEGIQVGGVRREFVVTTLLKKCF